MREQQQKLFPWSFKKLKNWFHIEIQSIKSIKTGIDDTVVIKQTKSTGGRVLLDDGNRQWLVFLQKIGVYIQISKKV